MNYDALIFDLDGTLADTADDIAASVAHAMTGESLPVPSRGTIVGAIGGGVGKLIERLVAEAERRPAVLKAFLRHYGEHLLDRTRLYPGVSETLAALDGAALAVVSNKPEAFTRRILQGLGIAGRFRAVFGGDSLPVRKPDPAVVRAVLAAIGGSRPLLVGDSGTDVRTARNAGIPCCAVTYGYHRPGELDGADHRIGRFDDLVGLVRFESK